MAEAWTRRASFTRPANTTQYADGDAVSDDTSAPTALSWTLPGPGQTALLRSVTLVKDDQDLTGAAFDLLLFSASPAAAGFDDNASIAITDDEFSDDFLGFVRLTQANGVNAQTGDIWTKSVLDLPIQGDSSRIVYGVLVARGTYTPASGEKFTVILGGS